MDRFWYIDGRESEMYRTVRLIIMKFYYVYVLKSLRKNWLYVGITSDLRKRFKEHNVGKSMSTKAYAPFELIFYEAYRNLKDAKGREQYLKTTKGKTTLKSMLREYMRV